MLSKLLSLQQKQNLLVKLAKTCLDKPYLYAATPEEAPQKFDCSSLTQYLYKNIGVIIPRSALLQAHEGTPTSYDKLKTGDLLFFKGEVGHYNAEFPIGIGHVVMYLGNDLAIQANGTEGKVIITPLSVIKKRKDLVVIKTLLTSRREKLKQKFETVFKKTMI